MIVLDRICKDRFISDYNKKADMYRDALREYDVPFRELSPGTNRYCVRIDGYVFKFAMDKYGIRDNYIEFSMSAELQPYVTKTYECNGLIVVAEYVTVIDKEEFRNSEEPIKGILGILASRYLIGDVGYVTKNYLNWGYREDGTLCILDYGFIYKVSGEEVRCDRVNKDGKVCGTFLDYDENFKDLVCPKCKAKYTFTDVRRKMNMDYEEITIERAKSECYLMKSDTAIVDDSTLKISCSAFDDNIDDTEINKEETEMLLNDNYFDITEEESIAAFDDAVLNYDPNKIVHNHVDECSWENEIQTESYDEEFISDDEDTDDDVMEGLGSDLYDNRNGDYFEADELIYTLANIFKSVVMFTSERIQDSDIPEGFYKYELKGDPDYEFPYEIGTKVILDFYGTILSPNPICDLTDDVMFEIDLDDFALLNKEVTIDEYKELIKNHREAEGKSVDDEPECECDFDMDEDEEFIEDPEEPEYYEEDEADKVETEDVEEEVVIEETVCDSEEEEEETLPTEEDTVIPGDAFETPEIEDDEDCEYEDSDEDEDDEEESEDEEEEELFDGKSFAEAVMEEAFEETVEQSIISEEEVAELLEESDEDEEDEEDEIEEHETSSFTSWCPPKAELEQLLREEEEEDRNRAMNKRHKHNKKYR